MGKITPDQWSTLRHFRPDSIDDFGDPKKMSFSLLQTLDAYRSYIDRPIIVTFGTQGIHSPRSLHYTGHAVDIYVLLSRADTPLDIFISACRFPFSGIGIYPNWSGIHRGQRYPFAFGMHLEQGSSALEVNQTLKLWVGYYDDNRTQKYKGLDSQAVREYKLHRPQSER